MKNPIECRRFVRIKKSFHLKHGKLQSGALVGEEQEGFSKDFSAGGVSFASSVPYNIDDVIQLEIDLPGWKKFESESQSLTVPGKSDTIMILGKLTRVIKMRTDLYDIGLSFFDLNDKNRGALIKYVNEQLK